MKKTHSMANGVVVSKRNGLVTIVSQADLINIMNKSSRTSLAIEDVKVTDTQWSNILAVSSMMARAVPKFG